MAEQLMTTPPTASTLPAKSDMQASNTQPAGLTSDEARRRLEKFGPNAMPDTSAAPVAHGV